MKKWTILAILVLLLATALPALAHETRTTDDGLDLVFGWRSEPALAGEPNGPEIRIALSVTEEHEEEEHEEEGEHSEESGDHHGDEGVVEDAELQVEITFGDQSITLELRPAYGEPGWYVADLIPTLPGDYTFRVTGTAAGIEIDEVFTSADGEFSSVEPASDIQFPLAAPSAVELMALIEDLQAQIDELRAQLAE